MWGWLKQQYQTNTKFRGFVQAVEAASVAGFLAWSANGFNFTAQGWHDLGITVSTAVGVAVRNFLINPPNSPAGPSQ